MPRLRYSATAQADIGQIYQYIRQKSGSGTVALGFTRRIRAKCEQLARAPIVMGRSRPELRPDLRSHPFEAYIIFFLYVGDVFEVVNVLEGHRDIEAFYSDKERS